MPFFRALSVRAKEDELMDDFSMGGEELREALKHLRRLNRIFAAPGPTKDGVEKLWQAIGRPDELTILDVGAGSGDVNVKLLQWADKMGINLRITLVDMTEEACEEARKLFLDEPRVNVMRADLQELNDASADIVTGSQFVHHFDGEQLVDMVAHMRRASRYGVVINDIHRHAVSYTAVWVMTRIISRNRYIRHDGPLSVAKGFKGEDWQELKHKLQAEAMTYTWKPLFRYSVVIPKQVSSQ
ncbi:methyltransferase domain-containing protein [Paenibacillus sp. FSL R7-0331]|uniref:methyltransferase domain-containing protein n=1 Tax=Paenibacillus sp. FSL R7-0331 TaxID=1536773 RepID=UPI0004F5A61F|nr:methyltransferase domain-containing protein [Paenibacillus sp. FSL R7-0331]AIQ52816.1 stilbene synthase [Paenibacillus sp. FSL R7-0331]